jgi:hypothetical protein
MPWPRRVPPCLSDLTWPELLSLRVRLGRARRRALSAAWHARRPRQVLACRLTCLADVGCFAGVEPVLPGVSLCMGAAFA